MARKVIQADFLNQPTTTNGPGRHRGSDSSFPPPVYWIALTERSTLVLKGEECSQSSVGSKGRPQQCSEELETCDFEFPVDFLVSGDDGTADEMIFLSTVPASHFFRKVAEAMEVNRDDVNIAYRFYTWKATDLSQKLKTAAHLETLFTKTKTAMEDL
ncbi:hypothetical protein B0H16DRAFT_1459663 [Mycena metata]|uniref:Uncharacterized protein n=1 Tax=Mycena metata TaxID=1033252 RepID=A0AAD7IZX9_9AGAR|nr:hypothetical protein B0H16DRAFT_1459663 [Mycena metata]